MIKQLLKILVNATPLCTIKNHTEVGKEKRRKKNETRIEIVDIIKKNTIPKPEESCRRADRMLTREAS